MIEDVVGTYELSSCYNVTIDCRAADMIATVRTNKIFNGKIYAKDNPNSCVVDVDSAIEFNIKMGYNDIGKLIISSPIRKLMFHFFLIECNVKRKSQGVYTNEVIIQHHDSIVTALDLGLALHCQYDLSNRTILNDFDLAIEGEIEPSMFEESVVDSPNVVMKVTERGGEDVKSAQVGDPLELHFEILDQASPYEIFVRDLVAKDGNDQSEIVLIDSRGCPTEAQIMGPLVQDATTSKILLSNFDAFKFPTSEVVQFRAHVTPCMPTCEPVECLYEDYYGSGDKNRVSSYGRKKRDVSRVTREAKDRVLVTNSFVVMDKFQKNKKKAPEPMAPYQSVMTTQPKMTVPPLSSLPWKNLEEPQSQQPEFMNFGFEETIKAEPKLDQSEIDEDEKEPELCINATGIIVSIVLFLVLQIIIAVVSIKFWQRKKSRRNFHQASPHHHPEDFAKQIFNPYAIRN